MRRLVGWVACGLLVIMTGAAWKAEAVPVAALPAGFQSMLVTSGLQSPTAMAFAPDGRLFVAEQRGNLRVIQNGTLLPTPFLSVNVNYSGERGLLGLAFDPNFASNNYIYIYYTTASSPIHNRIVRYTANGNVVVPGSAFPLLDLNNLTTASNHNGGAMHFGPDGKLYVAVGENATRSNSQTLSNLLGKMLRINSNGTIPNDNPFYNTATGNNRAIWALGLRNPFTFAFQPGTGRMFINDVGASTWEEINDGIAGSNYGWPTYEGPTNVPGYRSPLLAYPHANGAYNGCAITGGTFYNPSVVEFPVSYVGSYFFADYCGNFIRRFNPANGIDYAFAGDTANNIVDLKVGPDGSLYYLARGTSTNDGRVYRIEYFLNQTPPTITQNPQDVLVAVGESAQFQCAAHGSLPLRYQWQRNLVNIPGATASKYTLPVTTMNDNGADFRCIVSNDGGSVTSASAELTVINGQRPIVTLNTPTLGTLYQAGQTINYSGTATDPDEGTLPLSAYEWEVVFHHDTHTHPFVLPYTGTAGGTFDTPTESHSATNVWYRIRLTATDSTGLTRTVTRDVRPQTTIVTLRSVRSGLQINVDGVPYYTPAVISEIVGTIWNVEAVTPQSLSGIRWDFESWSDGGAATHDITIPSGNPNYTVEFFGCPILDPAQPNAAPQRNFFNVPEATLHWTRVPWAAGYWIQVDNSPTFNDPEYSNDTLTADNLSITVTGLRDCTYYWRVRPKNANGTWGTFSAADSFVIDAP